MSLYLDSVRHCLNVEQVDVFFAEYVSPADDMTQVQVVLDELRWWKDSGVVRYVGVTTHNRAIALEMIERHQCDVLMHRYNMAHRQAEQNVLPAAQKAGIPVVAFTCTDINLPPAMDYHYYYSRLGKLPLLSELLAPGLLSIMIQCT